MSESPLILVVEDEYPLQGIVEAALIDGGCQTDILSSGEEALTLVGLADRMDFFPSQLSGGQQQRVAIARAIAKRPQVLLCDEPTGALDLRTSLSVLDTIERANRQLGTLTVIITHNAILGEMADRVIRLTGGRISTVERNYMPRPAYSLEW